MPAGRPSKKPRSAFAARVHALRIQAKLSQIEVAEKLGIAQQSYAAWERHDVALSVAQLEQLATIFNVPVTAFFAPELTEAMKPRGPTGRAKKAFEALSELPRNQQTRVLEFVEPLMRALQREHAERQAKAKNSAAG
jgi:transcriptional regulator with XRE-family HTH domain